MHRGRRVLQDARRHGRGEQIALGRFDAGDQSRVGTKPPGQLLDRGGEPLAHGMIGLLDDLAKSRLDRRQHALAVDETEKPRDADPEAWGETHPLAIAREEVVDQVAGGRAKRRPVEGLRQRAGPRRHDPTVPFVAPRDLQEAGEHRRQRAGEHEIA